jgi:spore coat protein U-like protein
MLPRKSYLCAKDGWLASCLLVLICIGWGSAGDAATATDSFTVSAEVTAVCEVIAQNLDFGTYDSASNSPSDAQSNIEVTCTPGADYDIGLSAGTGPGATVSDRSMLNGAVELNYGLYSDAARTTNWGNTVSIDTVEGTGDGTAINHTVYGRIPPGQYVAAGSYSDTIDVSVTY